MICKTLKYSAHNYKVVHNKTQTVAPFIKGILTLNLRPQLYAFAVVHLCHNGHNMSLFEV